MKKIILLLANLLFVFHLVTAQDDADGCKDHPLLTKLENFYISGCEENFNELQLRISSEKTEAKEGNQFHIYYRYNFDSGAKAKSAYQIIKNYEVALQNNGGKLVYKNTNIEVDDLEATYFCSTKEKDYWVKLSSFAGTPTAVEAFALDVLEMEPMKQEVTANKMFDALTKEGFIALYINFETGKSDIKAESKPIIDQIAEMMKQNSALKISIEGHTDNVGSVASNQSLSESRAKAVMNALIAKGFAANRFQSKGWGASKPIADNNTPEGKAKNRRVEIVKQK